MAVKILGSDEDALGVFGQRRIPIHRGNQGPRSSAYAHCERDCSGFLIAGRSVAKHLCLALIAFTSAAVAADVSESFYNAIRNGDRAAVKSLITAHGPNVKDRLGSTPLMYAAAFGSADMVGTLLAADADPNIANDLGATALMWPVNDVEKVRLLISNKANVNTKSKLGKTPLIIAASDDSGMPVVRMLVENGADVNAADYGPQTLPVAYPGRT